MMLRAWQKPELLLRALRLPRGLPLELPSS
jgi:hypothetical protein